VVHQVARRDRRRYEVSPYRTPNLDGIRFRLVEAAMVVRFIELFGVISCDLFRVLSWIVSYAKSKTIHGITRK